jgi:putative endopeptidase
MGLGFASECRFLEVPSHNGKCARQVQRGGSQNLTFVGRQIANARRIRDHSSELAKDAAQPQRRLIGRTLMPFASRISLVIWPLALACTFSASAADHARIGDYGFDAAGMDLSVKPGDDYNAYANGVWAKRTRIPGDHAYWGVWSVLDEQAQGHVRDILTNASKAHAPAGTNVRKLGDFYTTFMDDAAIEERGATPLKEQLASIARIDSYAQLATAMGGSIRIGDSMPVTTFVYPDFKRPDLYAVYLDQGGLGLPDRDYYLIDSAPMAAARVAYLAYAAKLLQLSGLAPSEGDSVTRAKKVFDLEHRLAEIQWSQVRQRDLPARYVPWTRADYPAKAPGFAWDAYFKAAGLGDQPVLIASVDTAISATAAIVPTVSLPVWRDYLAIRAVDGHAPFLSKAFVDAHFAFHATALAGTPDQEARWKRGSRFAEKAMGEAIGEIYVRQYFGPESKAAATQLVRNLLAAAGQRIDGLDWMSTATKIKAREKLDAFQVKIGYPDKWRDYSKLAVVSGDAYENALAADRFEYERNLAKVGRPVDRTEWGMTPMEINAYYDATKNEIVFPAAVLQPPFFDPHADLAVNYGGIGAIIGHEISHGFDDQGRLFDAHGALADWWTAADAEKYKQRTTALIAQYSAYEVLPGLKLNGELTLGENIGDNAGIVIAHDAYHTALGGKAPPVIDGQSGEQRFFLGFAQNWRTVWRDPILRQIVTTDPHSPDAIRVRTVRNFDSWYAAYDVKPGDALYLAPSERIRIW